MLFQKELLCTDLILLISPTGWSHMAACPLGTRWGSSRWWRTLTPSPTSSVTAATVPPPLPSTRTPCSTGSNLRIPSEYGEQLLTQWLLMEPQNVVFHCADTVLISLEVMTVFTPRKLALGPIYEHQMLFRATEFYPSIHFHIVYHNQQNPLNGLLPSNFHQLLVGGSPGASCVINCVPNTYPILVLVMFC